MNRATDPTNNTPSSVTRIVIVDDHPVVWEGLRVTLGAQPDLYVVATTSDPVEATTLVVDEAVEVLIFDVACRATDGLEQVKSWSTRFDDLAILIFSDQDETLYAPRALGAGARGFLPKSVPVQKVVDAVRDLRRGRVALTDEATELVLARVVAGVDPEETTPLQSLSDRELEVFRALGEGLGTRAVAERLGLSPKTIESYRENIKAKLGLSDANELVHAAVRWVSESD